MKQLPINKSRYFLPVVVVALWVIVMVSGLGVVHTTHESRLLMSELESLKHEAADLHVEWGQYLLEQSAWANYSRVEEIASDKLDMILPAPEQVVLVH